MIDTVIFDVGGVLFANPTEYIKNDVCQSLNLDRAIVDFAWKELIPDLGLGKITEDFFWEKFVKLTNCTSKLPKKSLFVREMEKKFAVFTGVMSIVESLKRSGYKLGIISDSIKPHVDFLSSKDLFVNFSVKIFSNEVGFRKPEPEIFRLALDQLKSKPENSVFIDDNLEFVNAAKNLGLNGINFVNEQKLKKDLEKLGIKITIVAEEEKTDIGANVIFVTPDNKIILQKRDINPNILNSGKISMFGGTIKLHENLKDGLRREILEETEIDIENYTILKLGVYYKTKEIDGQDYTVNVFLVKQVPVEKIRVHEGAGFVFDQAEVLLQNSDLTRTTRLALDDFVKLR